jgi:hypothetical protein
MPTSQSLIVIGVCSGVSGDNDDMQGFPSISRRVFPKKEKRKEKKERRGKKMKRKERKKGGRERKKGKGRKRKEKGDR